MSLEPIQTPKTPWALNTPVPVGALTPRGIRPVNPRTFTACMEQLQDGYVAAVAATAGLTVEFIQRDVFGLDVEFIKSRGENDEELSLRAQLKNTTTLSPDPNKQTFSFRFSERLHYVNLAKARTTVKAILVVMVTCPDQSSWTQSSHDALSVRHCCYWANLEGKAVPDVARPYVSVPTANIFDAAALTAMFTRLEGGQSI